MKYGIYLPNYGEELSALALADLAGEAEKAGWDGFFLWDHILGSKSQKVRILDPWIALTAMAMQTERIRLGTTVTPLARRRPWKLARETVTLDILSGGRLTLSVGLGEPQKVEFEMFGEDGDPKVRAARLDEGLEVLIGLWKGKPFSFHGQYYHVSKMTFLPTPAQSPRIPIWVGGFWSNKPPFRRAARFDGVIPLKKEGWLTPEDVKMILEFILHHRKDQTPFDIAVIGSWNTERMKGIKGAKKVEIYAQAGATWWLESFYMQRNSNEKLRTRIRQGIPY